MAFQNFFDNLNNTVHRDAVANPIVEAYIQPFRKSLNQFPWAVTPTILGLINKLGISATSFGTLPHPHPFHKIIETHLLENHWHHFATTPSTVMYMKPSKFEKLKEHNPNFQTLMNFRHTPKDVTRYPNSTPFYPATQNAFMHDALMYFKPSQIYDLFLKSPALDNLYASLVVPPETKLSLPSLYPNLYNINYTQPNITYTLEGGSSGEYEQPIDAVEWLTISIIKGPDFDLSVTVLESWYSIHSILITRSSKPSQHTRTFTTPNIIKLPGPITPLPLSSLLVPAEVYKQLFNYVRAVRTLRQTDPAGFVRTQANKPEYSWVSSSAWDELSNFALMTANERPHRAYKPYYSKFDQLKELISDWLRKHSNTIKTSLITSILGLSHITKLGFRFRNHLFGCMTLQEHRITIISPPFQSLPNLIYRLIPDFIINMFSKRSMYIEYLVPNHHFEFHIVKPSFIYGWAHPYKTAITTGCIVFALYFSMSWIFQPSTDLQQSNQYLSYFHPSPWVLSFQTRPVQVSPLGFFPPNTSILPAPETSTPKPSTPSSSPTSSEPQNSTLDSDSPTDIETAPIESPPTPSQDVSQEVRTSSPESVHQDAVPTDSSTTPALLRNNELVVGAATATRGTTPNTPTPLANDPSATGPIASFRSLHGFNMPIGQGEFLTRRRASPAVPPYPKLDCLLVALEQSIGIDRNHLWNSLSATFPDSQLVSENELNGGLTTDHLTALAWQHNFRINVQSQHGAFVVGPESNLQGSISHTSGSPGHWSSEPIPLRGAFTKTTKFAYPALDFRDSSGHQLPFRNIHWYSPVRGRAKNLSSNMKNDFDGILSTLYRNNPNLDSQFFNRLDAQTDFSSNRSVQLIHISGFPGCGKSFPISQLLLSKPFAGNFRVSVPTVNLREEWKKMLNLRSTEKWRVGTWESSLTKSSNVLVIDEIYKLPNGYLDLCLIADPSIQFVILLGDPTQASYKSLHPESTNHLIKSEIDHLAPYRDFYCFWTHRLSQAVAEKFGVKTTNPHKGVIAFNDTVNPKLTTLVASIPSSNIFNGNGIRSTTFAASQGITHSSHSQLFIDRNVQSLHPSVAFVALTRSRRGVIFCGNHQLLKIRGTCPLFEAFYFKEKIDFKMVFARELAGAEFIINPIIDRNSLPLRGGSSSAWNSIEKRFHRMTNFRFDPAHSNQSRPSSQASSRSVSPTFNFDPTRVTPPRSKTSKPLKSDYRDDVIIEAAPVRDIGDPVIPHVSTHFLPETRRPLHQDTPTALPSKTSFQDPEITSAAIEPVYPGIDYELLMQNFLPVHDPNDREITFRGELSNQFPWLDKDFEFGTQPPSLISPIHDIKNDPHLLLASIDKRLRFRPSETPYVVSPTDEATGHMLYAALCRAYHRNPNTIVPFDPVLYAECINVNEYHQLSSKTQSVIMANASRSDPDWRWTAVRIFSKTQHKVNEGSFFGSWKACQTLALMHDAIVLLFGPIKKYQRHFDEKDRPDNLFIYGGHTPFELSKHCQSHLTPTEAVCNDYTAFDQSQTGEAVVLERLKMQRLSIPTDLINKHVEIKTSITSQFGPLTCMRLTGEPGTYDDNTDYNIAVIYSEYNISNQTVYVSGDDSVVSPVPPTRTSWETNRSSLKVQFKKEFTNYPLFCGYYLGAAGAIRAPRPLFSKLAIALADGSLDDKLASYLAEFTVGHSLGDDFWSLLPVDQVEFQSACFDFFCRKCSREQKLSLKIGEVSESIISSIISTGAKWITRPLYALLNRHARIQVMHNNSYRISTIAEDPDLKGVLLP